jgi:hypothetical protein
MIIAKVETITPNIAAALLEGNQDNRKIKEATVSQYASDIVAGKWQLTGQPIIIADNGQLNDGQHRLAAVVKSGVAVDMMVIRGASRESRVAIDIGTVRGSGDVVQMFHVPNGAAVAALARLVISWERVGKNRLGRVGNVSKIDTIDRGVSDERLIYAVRIGSTCQKIVVYKQAAFARYVIQDSDLSDTFFARLADGINLEHGHPVLAVRNWFFRNGRKVTDMQGVEVILRGWCAFRDGRELINIKLMGDFPKL